MNVGQIIFIRSWFCVFLNCHLPNRSVYISFITLGLSFNLPGFKPDDELQFKCKPIDNELTTTGTKKSEWQHERSKDVLKFPPNMVRFFIKLIGSIWFKLLSYWLHARLIKKYFIYISFILISFQNVSTDVMMTQCQNLTSMESNISETGHCWTMV